MHHASSARKIDFMSRDDFNDKNQKAPFTYRKHPDFPYSYMIFGLDSKTNEYIPAGEYTVLDTDEDPALSEKKVINIITLMNGGSDLIKLGHLTESRLFYNIVKNDEDESKDKIIFREKKDNGISQENAMLMIEKGVFKDE